MMKRKKVIFVEGTDNTGKDTLINWLIPKFDNKVKVVHCDKPKGNTPEECMNNQERLFNQLCDETIYDIKHPYVDVVIYNRGPHGEYVYGTIYRDADRERTKTMINNIELKLLNELDDECDIYLITMLSDNAELLMRNDDGLSISNAKKGLIEKETLMFESITNMSMLHNTYTLFVNRGDNFKSLVEIREQVSMILDIDM